MIKSKFWVASNKVKIVRHSLFKKSDDGLFVVNLKTGLYYTINGSGEYIWMAIKKGKRPCRIAQDMAKHFRMGTQRAEREVALFLNKLEKEKLVIVSRRRSKKTAPHR